MVLASSQFLLHLLRGVGILGLFMLLLPRVLATAGSDCVVSPLGNGMDDTDQVEAAINQCGHFGTTTFQPGTYNITRKMTWELQSAKVDLHGFLSFIPDVEFWLDLENTYRVVFIQSQASWFVITGSDFEIDAHNTGGVQGNGQVWWDFFTNRTREDGDGRPIAFTLNNVTNGIVRNFRVESQPFWCNTVSHSSNVVYDGMYCNASNTNPEFFGENIVPNTDGINTYVSDNVTLLNWDITCGDDCLAIKGNSTNLFVRNVTCHGGNGIAFGSLGQYANLSDIVENVHMEDLKLVRIDSDIQPNMKNAVYFKTWSGTVNGEPPTGGGGRVHNVTVQDVVYDQVDRPLLLTQRNGAHSNDLPSKLMFSNLTFVNWSGTFKSTTVVDLECSPAVGCDNVSFDNFTFTSLSGDDLKFVCKNVENLSGLNGTSSRGFYGSTFIQDTTLNSIARDLPGFTEIAGGRHVPLVGN
ncbi:hypothetical protein D9758_006142 [Tetrapyrgos nigripes]|uniref:galacturonan 1,4-alpha-galacturonidase n=1 Tax=Tetrapyrgos nigripes TaxID=182062 RepID=A0A8H5LL36_9AGAR|nr:hypothetical protein D9758_006142 [Tetrapyrgos nigripes]